MRMYQEVGLKHEANEWILKNCKVEPKSFCPHCNHVLDYGLVSKVYEKKDSFYGDGPNLRIFECNDGSTVKEIVQAEPWSSGPVSFFCLQKENGELMFEWTIEEMGEHL